MNKQDLRACSNQKPNLFSVKKIEMGKYFSENNVWGKGAIAYVESLGADPEYPRSPHERS
ncbi:MAG: hypothetical protein HC890_06050 [Chloroflexaceae bacterium]|nr:hypothetical protein [Chloroflexaceae bacterium]